MAEDETDFAHYCVDADDLWNFALEQQTSADLWEHIAQASDVLRQAQDQDAPLSSSLAALAQHFIVQEDNLPRERLASMLALAVLRMAQGRDA